MTSDPEKALARCCTRAKVIKALAHPSRILIAETLSSRGEACVQDLAAVVQSDISTISKHLSIMKKAGLVCAEKRGLHQFYRICCDCLGEFFDCVDSIADDPG